MSLKASVSGSKLSSSTSKLALVRPTAVSFLQAANAEKSRKQVRSASTPKIPSAISLAKSSASAASSEAAGSGIRRPSSASSLQQLCQQNKDRSSTKGSLCPKPKARVLSVSTSQTKAPVKAQGKQILCMACLLLWLLKANVTLKACYLFHCASVHLWEGICI